MEEECKYIRIGTELYKQQKQPMANGNHKTFLSPWKFSTLAQDKGKGFAATIPKYDGFCNIPDHVNYRREHGGFYNIYNPITHIPKEGLFSHVLSLVEHIFEDQMELGLDYLSLLYLRPVKKLPILLLVSEERNTGKTTFLNFLKAMLQDNVTFNTNEDFRSKFNSDWAGKLIIAVDEVLLNKREDAERLKNLSTATTYKMEAKGKDRHEVEFYGKFVLCSNNETNPIIIDPGELRYWVRKIRPLNFDDTHFLEKIKEEIPAFLNYLQHRPLSTHEESRMWFNPSLIHTDALDRIIDSSRDRTESDIVELLRDLMAINHVDSVSFCINDLAHLLNSYTNSSEVSRIRRVIKNGWALKPADNSLTYTAYVHDFNQLGYFDTVTRCGRYYTVTKEFLSRF